MTWYPECASTPEAGPTWTPPTIGNTFPQRRLREANSAALPPKASMMADKAALQFHKKQAIKHGIDTPKGMAHLDQMKTHMGNIQKSKKKMQDDQQLQQQAQAPPGQTGQAQQQPQQQAPQARVVPKQSLQPPQAGAAGKSNPVPGIPNKKDQPSEDIRQDKPLIRLRQKQEAIRNFGREANEGGPGSGPRKGSGKPTGRDFGPKDNPTHYTTPKKINGKWRLVKLPYDVEGGNFAKKMNDKGYSQGTFESKESRTKESNSGEFQYNNPAYEAPKRIPGWSGNGAVYSPPVLEAKKENLSSSNIKEF